MDDASLPAFRKALVGWFGRSARDLPWRRTRDPYAIWISEIMLQQTTVVAVVPYFERFLARFPTLADLAAADEDDVLRLWEGLGYYSRARNLHRAAKAVVESWGGAFPRGVDALRALPGIGRYTAGAIASFAFDARAPIVEANTLRLYCRLMGYDGDPRSADGQRALWEFAERVLPATRAGRFNQALMELGATICTPQSPACPSCPVSPWCAAFATSRQNDIPRPARRPETIAVTHAAVALRDGDRWLLRRCAPGERWAGLWDFPRIVDLPPASLAVRRELESSVARLIGVDIRLGPLFHRLKHSVTRYRIELICFEASLAESAAARDLDDEGGLKWVTRDDFAATPLSMTGRKIADVLTRRNSTTPVRGERNTDLH